MMTCGTLLGNNIQMDSDDFDNGEYPLKIPSNTITYVFHVLKSNIYNDQNSEVYVYQLHQKWTLPCVLIS